MHYVEARFQGLPIGSARCQAERRDLVQARLKSQLASGAYALARVRNPTPSRNLVLSALAISSSSNDAEAQSEVWAGRWSHWLPHSMSALLDVGVIEDVCASGSDGTMGA
jgi:hypothetical protein